MKLEKPPQGLAHDTKDTDLMPLPVSWNHVPLPYGVTALWSALPGRMSGESSTLAFKPRISLGSVRAGAAFGQLRIHAAPPASPNPGLMCILMACRH